MSVRILKYSIYITAFVVTVSCYKELEIQVQPGFKFSAETGNFIRINDASCFLDTASKTFLFPIKKDSVAEYAPVISFQLDYPDLFINDVHIKNQQVNNLGNIKINTPYAVDFYSGNEIKDKFQLVFTPLPVIQVMIDEDIVDEPKKACKLLVNDPFSGTNPAYTQQYSTYAGIEIRGGISQNYPKKSYNIELWDDIQGSYTNKISLLGLRSDDDWIIDAMYIDQARMRNRASWEIWKSFDSPQKYNSFQNPHLSIDGKFIEVFLNNNYLGLYCLNERVDPKLCVEYGMNFYDKEAAIYRAKNWSEAVWFTACPDTNNTMGWNDGWLQEFPDDFTRWEPLYKFVDFVVNSPDTTFADHIDTFINLDNTIDYYIFLNLMQGFDNQAKNTLLVKANNRVPFIIVPWDMDGTFGRNWDASHLGYDYILTNNFYERLIGLNAQNYKERLAARWDELRSDRLISSAVISKFNSYHSLFSHCGVINRENNRWKESQLELDKEIGYITGWVQKRLNFLDEYFHELN